LLTFGRVQSLLDSQNRQIWKDEMKKDRQKPAALDAVHAVMVEVQRDFMRYLKRQLGNEEEAADVLHDFYLKVLKHFEDVRDPERLRPWMRRVLQTSLVDYYRAHGKRRDAETDYQYLDSVARNDSIDGDLDRLVCSCLYKLLPTLKPEYAEVIWRADLVGETSETIAKSLDISNDNFRVRLHRARQSLRARLEETCRTCPSHGYTDCGCGY